MLAAEFIYHFMHNLVNMKALVAEGMNGQMISYCLYNLKILEIEQ